MKSWRSLPLTNATEIDSIAEELPIAVDREHFRSFVLGFPRSYLSNTPQVEIVKHYVLAESVKERPVISSISREGAEWKLCLITRDRTALFSRIAGALSCFSMNITSAQAFANANSLVLDTFTFADQENVFRDWEARQRFQAFLEDVLEGKIDLEASLRERWPNVQIEVGEHFELEIDNEAHPSFTLLSLRCRDHFGLLYLVSRCISELGHNIEIAYANTQDDRVSDQFFLTHDSRKLSLPEQRELIDRLGRLTDQILQPESGQPG